VIAAWGPALLPALVAALLLVVPGLVVNLAVGARGFDALGLAPLTSLGVLAIATLMVPLVVGRWSLAAVAVTLPLVTLVAVLGRVIIARWTGGRSRDRLELSMSGLWRAVLGDRPSPRWWMPRRRTTWWLASTGLAAAIVAANFMLGVRDANLPSQTIDAGFHYNAVLAVIRSGIPTGAEVGAASGAAVTTWYPPLWHDLTALVSSVTGVNVAIGANAVGWAIGGVVWPLSMVWLCSRILPHARLLTTLALGLCCGTITLFPYIMLSFGVLWPNVLSLAALPAAIALTLMVLHLMPRSPHAQDDISSAGVPADGATLDETEVEPEAGAVVVEEEEESAASDEDKARLKLAGVSGVQRYKGLGEMNADQLWDTTMDPANRVLLKVAIEDAERADAIFNKLMGEEVLLRKNFISSKATTLSTNDLDI